MEYNPFPKDEINFRVLYGKLFATLINQFGIQYTTEIEDAIQNAFYKALKTWKPNQAPNKPENWLFIVARNDVLNQIKKDIQKNANINLWEHQVIEFSKEDLRLKTMLFLSKSKTISSKTKILFILKNIFGLSIKEISECTLLSQEAIYKSINRAKTEFQQYAKNHDFDLAFEKITQVEIDIVEEILYAVFNIGFDSFNEKVATIVNEDLCIEAIAISKLLLTQFSAPTTKSLLSLFCFHIARVEAKTDAGKFISFFNQDKSKWNKELIDLGFYYLQKPETVNKYYIESLIISKHMTVNNPDWKHWNEIIQLYKMLIPISNSPIAQLNLCYCLMKANRLEESNTLLKKLENDLPMDHTYFSIVKASIFKTENPFESEKIINHLLKNIHQKIRRDYLLENNIF